MTQLAWPSKMWRWPTGFTRGRSPRRIKSELFLLCSLIVLAWAIWKPTVVVIDTDQNGRWDQKLYSRFRVPLKKLIDTNGDGAADLWIFYRGGIPHELRQDVNLDGRVDLWAFYEGNEISRVKTDLNFDGKIDYEGPYRLRKKH